MKIDMRRRKQIRRRLSIFCLASWAVVSPAPPALAAAADPAQGSGRAAAPRDEAGREDPAALLERGIDLLTGPGSDRDALAAFLTAAELSERPASAWLWAAVAAERLGLFADAGGYKARALAPAPPTHPAPAAAAPAPASPAVRSKNPVPPSPPAEPGTAVVAPTSEPARTEPEAATGSEEVAEENRAETEEPAAKEEEADAFQYFFGKRPQPKGETEEPPARPPAR